ncbi:MAG: LURP-one-related family protein [Chloroflexi bacterium]|nr:LURP-one-related family protein [Chloroflexota bacterium]
MQYQIKQRVFSIGDRYDITNEQGQPAFEVRSHLFAMGHKLDLLDTAGNLVAQIQQRVLSLTSEYDIYRGGQVTAIVKKKIFALLHPQFTVEGPGGTYAMEGDWMNWNYTIAQNGVPVAQISKQFSMFQDQYGVRIADGADVPTLLCLAIVMDEVAHPDQQN